MNRTARCIRMLMILKSRQTVCTSELAELLETNPRNIREYKKELEQAGYTIKTVRGAGGGYELEGGAVLPLPLYNDESIDILTTIRDSLLSTPNQPYAAKGAELLDEIIASNPVSDPEKPIYFTPSRINDFSESAKDDLSRIRKAVFHRQQISILYHSRESKDPIRRVVDPYDVVCSDGNWYFVGFDHYRQAVRTFRISPARLLKLELLDTTFERQADFKLKDYLGTSALTRADKEIYLIEVCKEQCRFFEEIRWGQSFAKIGEQREGWVTYSFFCDDPAHIERNLFRFGNDVILLAPKWLAKEYTDKLASILDLYRD